MLTKKELIAECENKNLNYYEVYYSEEIFNSFSIYLDTDNITVFFDYINENGIDVTYYRYYYYDKSKYHIEEELFERYPAGLYSSFIEEINEYNSKIDGLNFSKPFELMIFCLNESKSIVLNLKDYWLENMGFLSGIDYVEKIISENEKTVEKIEMKNELKNSKLEEEFKKFILSDSEFRKQTNSMLRNAYLESLSKRHDAEKFQDYFFDERGHPVYKARIVLEQAWKDYKNNL